MASPAPESEFRRLRLEETKRRPRPEYMESVQKYIDPRSRAHCVGMLIDAAKGLRYTPQTLHLTVNCLDRYLSGNVIDCDELEFLGLTCLMIASKYEEVRGGFDDLDAYSDLTENTCSRADFISAETAVLASLEYGLAVPTTWTFLEMLVGPTDSSLAAYIAHVSLVSYAMLCFEPSMVAASSVFLARYVLDPCVAPWNYELQEYTGYGAADLRDCVSTLLSSCQFKMMPNMTRKYTRLACNVFPPSIPLPCFLF